MAKPGSRSFWWVGGLALVVALEAGAAKVGDSLWVKAAEASLLEKPSATARVLKTLPAGTKVVWLGAAPREKKFHRVRVEGTEGFLHQDELTPTRPASSPPPARGDRL